MSIPSAPTGVAVGKSAEVNADQRVKLVPIRELVCREQVRRRFDEDALKGMAEHLRIIGIQQPLLCREDGSTLVVVDGERRLRAAKIAGLTTVPVLVMSHVDAVAVIERQLSVNLQRQDLDPVEKAHGIARLIRDADITASEAAKRLGQSESSVSRLLHVVRLPEHVQDLMAAGRLPVSAAPELARIDNRVLLAEAVRNLMSGAITRDGLAGQRKAAERAKKSSDESTSALARRVVLPLGAGQSVTVIGQMGELPEVISVLEELLSKARTARGKGLSLGTFAKMLRDQADAAGGR